MSQADGRGRRTADQGARRHPAQELDALGIALRLRLDDLGGHPFLGRAHLGEDSRRSGMCQRALVRAEIRGDGFSHDRMRELEPFGRSEDLQLDQLIGRIDRFIVADPGQPGGLGEARAVADHRDRADERCGGQRPVGQSKQDRVGDGGRPELTHQAGLVGVRREPSLGDLAQQRLEEERIAAGRLATG